MQKTVFLLLIISSLAMGSCALNSPCSTKEDFSVSYGQFIAEITSQYSTLTEQQWESKDADINEYLDLCYEKYKEDLNIKEKVSFWKNALTYAQYRSKGNEGRGLQITDKIETKLKEELRSFSTDAQKEIDLFFKREVAPQVERVLDELLQGVEEFGKELKVIFGDIDKKNQ